MKESLLRKFRQNVAGIAAVEFALLAPLLMLMLFGALEASRAVMMHKRFQRATAMLGDLVSREQSIGTSPSNGQAALDGMYLSAKHIMEPFDMTSFRIDIMQIRDLVNGAIGPTIEDWHYTKTGSGTSTANITCVTKAMPAADMVTDGNAAIHVIATYKYKPYIANLAPEGFGGPVDWTDTITNSPRKGNYVQFGRNDGSPNCSGAGSPTP
jgi:Flp pilus assembly pilin Flp